MIETENYIKQKQDWPNKGRHILAQYDEESIIVYQAFNPKIANYALKNQRFGGEYSFSRMSWIKPNFLWMMYRSGWGIKAGQEFILALRLKKAFFDDVLIEAGWSSFSTERYQNHEEWKTHVQNTEVRLQWDPDHSPDGSKEERKAIQLGLKDKMLAKLNDEGIIEIINMNSLLEEQRAIALSGNWENLKTPAERVFFPSNKAKQNICLSPVNNTTE